MSHSAWDRNIVRQRPDQALDEIDELQAKLRQAIDALRDAHIMLGPKTEAGQRVARAILKLGEQKP